MVDVLSTQRDDVLPSSFKRRRLSANRQYPRGCGRLITQPREAVTHATVRTRKGVGVKNNASLTDSKDCSLDFWIPVEDYEKSDASKNSCPAIEIPKAYCKRSDGLGANHESKGGRKYKLELGACSGGEHKLELGVLVEDSSFTFSREDTCAFSFEQKGDKKQENLSWTVKHCKQKGISTDDKRSSLRKIASKCNVVGDGQCLEYVLKDKRGEKSIASSDEECERAVEKYVRSLPTSNYEDSTSKGMVREVRNLFHKVCGLLSQKSGTKNGITMVAAKILRKLNKCINVDKQIGPIKGIEVGDCFCSRAEMNVIGLHRHDIWGIDYTERDGRILAISIVDSRRYGNFLVSNDNQEFSCTLVYSGEGQNPKIMTKEQHVEDQKLEKGNLALKNSAEVKTSVRVIRKVSIRDVRRRDVFVYDGLYYVDCLREETVRGKRVFKFELKRFPNQRKVHYANLEHVCVDFFEGKEHVFVNDIISEGKEHVCVDDISDGKEKIPIRVVNELDNEKPPFFNYVTDVIYPWSDRPSTSGGNCDCGDGCLDFGECACVKKNGGQIPYDDEGCILKAGPLIIECGRSCKCFSSCSNTVSQNGIRFQLEVFKTKSKEWGVKSLSFIPRGSFICEYTGEILGKKDAEREVDNDEYLFDIRNNLTNCSVGDGEAALLHSSNGNECFTVNAARYGNVGRFINHSCRPNLFAQNVLFGHDNSNMPHIMFFAMEDIYPEEELTYDYSYRICNFCFKHGNVKMKACRCGSKECTGRLFH